MSATTGPGSTPAWGRRDLAVTLASLLALLAWDASGLDLQAARLFGTAQGFPWRDSWWAAQLLHDGGRLLAGAVLTALAVALWRSALAPQRLASTGSPGPRQRGYWLALVLLGLLLVPALKRGSVTSCPWDLALFGGPASYVSHWDLGQADGGGGHCFPSGHAVAAFAFLAQYFLWRDHAPARARAWLQAVLAAGSLFGLAQLARGAHFPSHTAWSAWICWAGCAAADAVWRRRQDPQALA